jgi:hypothetical protein
VTTILQTLTIQVWEGAQMGLDMHVFVAGLLSHDAPGPTQEKDT